jgi:hypothetical protein
MRVRCVRVPIPFDGAELESSPWVTVGREYPVLEVMAEFGTRIELHLLTDDGENIGWFDSHCFEVTDSTFPPNWIAHISEDGTFELGPASWREKGFWERYYDDFDPAAIETVKREIAIILDHQSP